MTTLKNSGQLRIKQLVYQNAKDSNKVFYCYLIFFANFLLQLLKFIKQAVVGPRNWSLLTITLFLSFDTMTLYYLVMTTLKINEAIDEFRLGESNCSAISNKVAVYLLKAFIRSTKPSSVWRGLQKSALSSQHYQRQPVLQNTSSYYNILCVEQYQK